MALNKFAELMANALSLYSTVGEISIGHAQVS